MNMQNLSLYNTVNTKLNSSVKITLEQKVIFKWAVEQTTKIIQHTEPIQGRGADSGCTEPGD